MTVIKYHRAGLSKAGEGRNALFLATHQRTKNSIAAQAADRRTRPEFAFPECTDLQGGVKRAA
jgi:hypothetical protein